MRKLARTVNLVDSTTESCAIPRYAHRDKRLFCTLKTPICRTIMHTDMQTELPG